jgi:hypothetical protein
MRTIRSKLTYANVMATVAVFIALGGSAYAATQLKKNSVGTKQIKNQAVTAAKIKNGAITGAQVKSGSLTGTQINASTLGTVPAAQTATTAQTANSATTAGTASALTPPEAINLVNAPNEPSFEGGSRNLVSPVVSGLPATGFYKDHDGIVHIEGAVQVGKEELFSNFVPIFTLPPGFRPANGVIQIFAGGGEGNGIIIAGAGASFEGQSLKAGTVYGGKEKEALLGGVTYRPQG